MLTKTHILTNNRENYTGLIKYYKPPNSQLLSV